VDFKTLQGTLQVKTDQSLKNQAAQSVGIKKRKEATFLLHLRVVWWNNNVERERERELSTDSIKQVSSTPHLYPSKLVQFTHQTYKLHHPVLHFNSNRQLWFPRAILSCVSKRVHNEKMMLSRTSYIWVFLSFYTHFHSTHLQWF